MIFIIVINSFFFIFSVVPLWNFKQSSIELLQNRNNYSYEIAYKYIYEMEVKLEKTIYKNEVGKIIHENYLTAKNEAKIKVKFENIDSSYKLDGYGKIICPMGKYNPFRLDNNNMEEIINNNFNQAEYDWNLKCYYHRTGHFLTSYLNNGENQIYFLKSDYTYKSEHLKIHNEMYDFKLVNLEYNNDRNPYPMCALVKWDNYIQFIGTKLNLANNDAIFIQNEIGKTLIEAKKYSQANFLSDTNDFFYFTYNNISDFSSGFSTKTVVGQNYFTNDVEVKNNYNSPFEFIDEVSWCIRYNFK